MPGSLRLVFEPTPEDLGRVRGLVARHGWNTTAPQLANPGLAYAFDAAADAVTAFVETAGWWVVAGAPVADEAALPRALEVLEAAARSRRRRVAYFAAEARLEAVVRARPREARQHARLRLGAQPFFAPARFAEELARHASLRAQLHRARHKGVTVEEWDARRADRDPAIARCLAQWLARRGLPPLQFLTTPWTLGRLEGRRVFVAECRNEVVGFLVASPIEPRRVALIEQNVRGDEAPNGTAESLIAAAFAGLAETCDEVTLGLAPLALRGAGGDGDGGDGVERRGRAGSPDALWLALLSRWARAHGRRFYNFRGLEAFKTKLGPSRWESVWLLVDAPRITPSVLWSVVGAFAGGRPIRFLAAALGRAARRELTGALGVVAGGGAPRR
jgi:phosphatidylglycerol lysyltransferase